ncbi:MAG: HD-GYP domain-containing protein [Gemmatimonadetes bacterium]|nr:HD-GYP domain-containing protein [Gemmatimonadota bacterium]
MIAYDLVGIPIVLGFALAYQTVGWAWSGALLLPLLGLQHLYKSTRELENESEELLQLLVATVEARDPYTSGHSQRVAAYVRVVADAAGIGTKAVDRVAMAALLHDVGKIHEEFAPILRKPGRLTDAEFAVMKSHPEKGAAIVSKVSQFRDLLPAIRSHHEAWDGSGYPDGLKGDAIPLWARMVAIADTMDAMTTDRPYRDALSPSLVRAELRRESGRQFDPAIVAALITDSNWQKMEIVLRASGAPRSDEHTLPPTLRHSGAVSTQE